MYNHKGGRIPNYKNKNLLNAQINRLNIYNPLNKNDDKSIINSAKNIIIFNKDKEIYELDDDFDLVEVPVKELIEERKVIIKNLIQDKCFQVGEKLYPYYYIYYDDRFKFIDYLLFLCGSNVTELIANPIVEESKSDSACENAASAAGKCSSATCEICNKVKTSVKASVKAGVKASVKSESEKEAENIKNFINKLFNVSENTIIDITKRGNLLNKYIFINSFKFLLDILFKNEYKFDNNKLAEELEEELEEESKEKIIKFTKLVSEQKKAKSKNDKAIATFETKLTKAIQESEKERIQIQIDRIRTQSAKYNKSEELLKKIVNDETIQMKKETMDEYKQNINLLNYSDYHFLQAIENKIKKNLILQKPEELQKPDSTINPALMTKYTNFYNKFYDIKYRLKEKFATLSLKNLDDLNTYQNNIVDRDESNLGAELLEINEKYLNKDMYQTKNEYLLKEIKEIFEYTYYLDLIKKLYNDEWLKFKTKIYAGEDEFNELYKTQENELGLIVLLSYFNKRVFMNKSLNIRSFNSFPINQEAVLKEFFSNFLYKLEDADNEIMSKYYNDNLPEYFNYMTVKYKDYEYPNCVENSVLQFVKTICWCGDHYDFSKIQNKEFKIFCETYVGKSQENTIECNNALVEILNKIDTKVIEYSRQSDHEPEHTAYEIAPTTRNIFICINYLLFGNIIDWDDTQESVDENLQKITKLNSDITNIICSFYIRSEIDEIDEGTITISSNHGSMTLKYKKENRRGNMSAHASITIDAFLNNIILEKIKHLLIFINNNLNSLISRINDNDDNIYCTFCNVLKQSTDYNTILMLILSNKLDHFFNEFDYYKKQPKPDIYFLNSNFTNQIFMCINLLKTKFNINKTITYNLSKKIINFLFANDTLKYIDSRLPSEDPTHRYNKFKNYFIFLLKNYETDLNTDKLLNKIYIMLFYIIFKYINLHQECQEYLDKLSTDPFFWVYTIFFKNEAYKEYIFNQLFEQRASISDILLPDIEYSHSGKNINKNIIFSNIIKLIILKDADWEEFDMTKFKVYMSSLNRRTDDSVGMAQSVESTASIAQSVESTASMAPSDESTDSMAMTQPDESTTTSALENKYLKYKNKYLKLKKEYMSIF